MMPTPDDKQEATQALPEACVVSDQRAVHWDRLKRAEHWCRVKRCIKKAFGVWAGLASFAVVVGVLSYACDAAKSSGCASRDGMKIEGIVRIKMMEHGQRLIYRQPPGSLKVDLIYTQRCSASFVADVPSDKAMWALERHAMVDRRCDCRLIFHVHSMTDPNVE